MEAQKHICGACRDEWLSEDEYLAHSCPSTGFTPTQAEHFGPEFAAVQKAALERGLDTLQAQGADATQIETQQNAIDQIQAV